MIEVACTIECSEAMSTDEAEQHIRDVINTEPGLRCKYVGWTTARHPNAPTSPLSERKDS